MTADEEGVQLLQQLDLRDYEAQALNRLLELGRTTAPNLAEATGIPKARIYGVLESLANAGYVEIIPGRPKEYQPKAPEEILERARTNRRQEFEAYCREVEGLESPFLEHFRPLFESADGEITPTEELFHVVDVGEPSVRETREIYRATEETLHVMTKSFEYLEEVEPSLRRALDSGVDVRVLFLHPQHLSEENRAVQERIRAYADEEFPGVDYRFSRQPMPWRGTISDPSMDYETGTAIFLVEEKNVPLHMRQAAVTDNGSFVAGLDRYFTLIWEHDSVDSPD